MSLINEALKKAQRQRSLDSAPLSSAPSGIAAAAVTTHVRAASHRRSNAPVWFALGLLVLGVGATVLIMRYGFASGPAPAPAPVAPPPVAPPVAVVPAPVAPATFAPEPLITLPPLVKVTPPSSAAPVPTPTPAFPATPAPQPVAVTPPSPPLAPAAPAAPHAAAPAPASVIPLIAPVPVPVAPVSVASGSEDRPAKIQAFLATIRLAGVRGFDAQARVLMNERVYRVNDVVDAALGLRLSAVRPGVMIFTDQQGKTYEKAY